MPEPIKITVVAETAAAAASLKQFVTSAGGGLKSIEQGAKSSSEALAANRKALTELGKAGHPWRTDCWRERIR